MSDSKDLSTIKSDIAREVETLGLPLEVAAQAEQLTQDLDIANNPEQISTLGQNSKTALNGYADQVLKHIKQDDLGELGAMLGEVVAQTRTLDVASLQDSQSKLPIIGGLINRFKTGKENFVLKFQSVETHINKLLEELSVGQTALLNRIGTLEQMFGLTQQEYIQLGAAVVAGKMELKKLQQQIIELSATSNTQIDAQRVSDLSALANRLDKRVNDLLILQASALQTLPTIRIIQGNNQMLVEKFNNIKDLTIPAWKRQFMLAVSLIEQSKAATLAKNIDDATNDILLRNAELLQQNSISVAKTNQRSVIDIATLEQVHKTLLSTIQEVQQIHAQGVTQRQANEKQIIELQHNLKTHLLDKPKTSNS